MKLFDGQAGTEYQDLLRALGHFADEQGWRSLRILEVEEGLLIQGLPSRSASVGEAEPRLSSRLFTEDELAGLLQVAYRRRRRPRSTSAATVAGDRLAS
jgi:hypothetical protein